MFGKPKEIAPDSVPEPKTETVTVYQVTAELVSGWQTQWKPATEEKAKELFDILTGPPDENGWIKTPDNFWPWARRADQITGVELRYEKEERTIDSS